jgi:hypothetical protein
LLPKVTCLPKKRGRYSLFLHHAPTDRTTTIRYKQIMNNPAQAVELIMDAVSASGPGA